MEKNHREIVGAIIIVSTALFVFFLARSRTGPPPSERAVPSAVMVR